MSINLIEEANTILMSPYDANDKRTEIYNRGNCQANVTSYYTNGSVYIHRNPNITFVDNTTRTMWAGFCIRPSIIHGKNILQKGHTYIFKFHAKGYTSNAMAYLWWNNNMGYEQASLLPAPSNEYKDSIPANFNGEKECLYKFTINDNLYKTCATSYNAQSLTEDNTFIAGNQYLSYRDLHIGWGYKSTGELGTDMYFSNFRLYDITDPQKISIVNKNGITNNIIAENNTSVKSCKDGEILGNTFYEI